MRLPQLFAMALSAAIVWPAAAQDSNSIAQPAPTPTADDAPDLVLSYQQTITPQDLAAHLYFFASDFFEGRETSTRGQRMAAEYLAAQYRKLGISPAGTEMSRDSRDPGAYLQPFPLHGRRLAGTELKLEGGGSSVFSAADRDGRSALVFGNIPEVSAGVVFGGYGIADADLGYDDFAAMAAAGLNYRENWLLILADEPLADAETSLLDTEDGLPSRWSDSPNNKLRRLFRTGLPKGVLMVGDSSPRSERSVGSIADEEAAGLGGVGSLSLEPSESGGTTPPVFLISTAFANEILASSGKTVADLQAEIAEDVSPVVFQVPDAKLSSKVNTENYETTSENVVAFIEGSDPVLKEEVVVVSSHYDHVGLTGKPEGEDQVYNGADDDGSGTVTILEIAEAFARARDAGHGPRRSVVFLNVSGRGKRGFWARGTTPTPSPFLTSRRPLPT